MLRMLVDRGDCKHRILSHIGMAMLETRPRGRKERFDKLRLSKFAEEAQRVASYVFVGML